MKYISENVYVWKTWKTHIGSKSNRNLLIIITEKSRVWVYQTGTDPMAQWYHWAPSALLGPYFVLYSVDLRPACLMNIGWLLVPCRDECCLVYSNRKKKISTTIWQNAEFYPEWTNRSSFLIPPTKCCGLRPGAKDWGGWELGEKTMPWLRPPPYNSP